MRAKLRFGGGSIGSVVRLYPLAMSGRSDREVGSSEGDDGSSRRGWITGGRGLLGAGLALAAFFAVVLTAVSVPGDGASAQVADPATEVEKRAKAWWDLLTPEERANAIFGKEYDAIADTPARDLPESTSSDYDELTPTGAQLLPPPPVISQALVNSVVNGNTDTTQTVDGTITDRGDIYAVGEHRAEVVSAIRGFQSVALWWEYLTCAEARIAVGEDNDGLRVVGTAADPQVEDSAVCDGTRDSESLGDPVASTSVKPYSQVKGVADRVGQAILGLDGPGVKSSAQNNRAEAWWNSIVDAVEGYLTAYFVVNVEVAGDNPYSRKDRALYGFVDRNTPDDPLVRNVDYDELADDVKALVNDRWRWIYNGGIDGINSEDKPAIVYWWDSLSCAQKVVLQGFDNEPDDNYEDGDECGTWEKITNPTPAPTDPGSSSDAASALSVETRTRFSYINAVLGTTLPAAEAWWNLLGELPDIRIDGVAYDRRVIAVYGNPPVPYVDHDSDGVGTGATPTQKRTPPDDEKALFEESYGELSGAIEVGPDEQLITRLAPFLVKELVEHAGFYARHGTTDGSKPLKGDIDGDGEDEYYYSAKQIVDGLALMVFDPVEEPVVRSGGNYVFAQGTVRTRPPDTGRFYGSNGNVEYFGNYEFNWPYKSDNSRASVADWWGTLDCRLKRMAVGEDNQYLNAGVDGNNDDDFEDEGDTPPETSAYCRHFPGSDDAAADGSNILSETDRKTVERVGAALLGLSAEEAPGRPSFNSEPVGTVSISGAARVGSLLTAEGVSSLSDGDNPGGIPSDAFEYRWIRVLADGTEIEIPGATGTSYTLRADDAGKAVLFRVSYVDGEEYTESLDSLATSMIVGSLGVISKIEPAIRGVIVSAGDKVVLSVDAYGRQGIQDQKLSAGSGLSWTVKDGAGIADDDADTPWEITYTAPASPGMYTIVASFANDGDCVAKLEERDEACSAEFEVRVRRPSAVQSEEEAAMNPPGEIPGILADDDGNQYAVFTPEDGGAFSGAGYSITAAAGAVPNGEFIGVRMSDDGAASNLGMTHQRYTLGGNMYGVHAVDGSAQSVSSYSLDDPATVCLPLPEALSGNISELAVVAMNGDGSLTILSAQVRISGAGTLVCGGLSTLPASVAVGSAGAPSAIPTATPEPTAAVPDTGGGAPSSSGAVWMFTLGAAVLLLGIGVYAAFGRRRRGFITTRKRE